MFFLNWSKKYSLAFMRQCLRRGFEGVRKCKEGAVEAGTHFRNWRVGAFVCLKCVVHSFEAFVMKRSSLFAACLLSFGAPLVFGADTAYDALRAASAKVGKDAQNRVVELSGKSGRPQPFVWRVVGAEEGGRGGVQEVDVQRGKVVGQKRMAVAPPGARMNLGAIQLDSDGVFSVANGEAIRAGVSFDRLNYTLSSDNQAGLPVWSVEFLDGPSQRVGSLKISADSGVVIERSGEMALSEEQKREARWSKVGEPYKSVPDFFHRAGKSMEKTGYKLKNWANGYGWTEETNPPVPKN